ncbi:hypothetical protein BpHYR1_027556 [Brachionus plicatilis]|uniref:Uncharacterized protein n=1 Tax=Brachionus plicatilis TaxID=10195 RepID=A0A3M7SNS4_BRAPC|nr:hypothetical protein BpHYR1_027556 [Brachionus plicatilis]
MMVSFTTSNIKHNHKNNLIIFQSKCPLRFMDQAHHTELLRNYICYRKNKSQNLLIFYFFSFYLFLHAGFEP